MGDESQGSPDGESGSQAESKRVNDRLREDLEEDNTIISEEGHGDEEEKTRRQAKREKKVGERVEKASQTGEGRRRR